MRTFLHQQIDGSLLRFAMDAHVGDGIEPDLRGRLDDAEVGQFEPMQICSLTGSYVMATAEQRGAV
jgi:hypothetical protein